jgi:ABC-type transporter Mla maintaining outer membrane lipid asymmetry ATPase subunit MlaF
MVNKLEWRHVNLTISKRNPKTKLAEARYILKNLCGVVTSGQLLAIIGPSGCGKFNWYILATLGY